jgi:hypothetical protein
MLRHITGMSIRAVTGLGAAALLLQLLLQLALVHGDASRFVHAAPPRTDPASAPASLTVGPQGTGFDGQFYYRQARAPISTAPSVEGITLDLPALRSERIVYPVLAAAVSLGRLSFLPWALILVNVAAGIALVGLVAALLMRLGHPGAWALVLLAYPGFIYTMGFDLAELVATALLAAGALALVQRRWFWAALAWSLAVLARETTAVVPLLTFVIMLTPLGAKQGSRMLRMLSSATPLVVLGVWQLVLREVFGVIPLSSSGSKNVGVPFKGVLDSASKFSPSTTDGAFRLVSIALLVVLVVVGLQCLRTSTLPTALKAAFLAEIAVLSTLSPFVWAGATSFMRAGSELGLLGVLVVATSTSPLRRFLPLAMGGAWALTLASQVLKA